MTKMSSVVSFTVAFFSLSLLAPVEAKDFNPKTSLAELTRTLQSEYAYLDRVNQDYEETLNTFMPLFNQARTEKEFIDISQMFLRNFRDPHLNLGPLDEDDYIVYPTGSDIYAEIIDSVIEIIDIKAGASAFKQGLRPGMIIDKVDGLTIHEIIETILGQPISNTTLAQQNYAVNIALGGKRYQNRTLEVIGVNETSNTTNVKNNIVHLKPSYDDINTFKNGPELSYKKIGQLGYIRFNNSLGNTQTISAFKEAINALSNMSGLIIDLRNTPSGGNTGVAEPILGHFTQTKKVYQQYQVQQTGSSYTEAAMQKAFVEPTAPFVNKPFVVLAGRWTGSMGEGMTVGLEALGAQASIGAPMADLLGGIKRVSLLNNAAWLEVGFERIYQANSEFREDFTPSLLLRSADVDAKGNDEALNVAIQYLNQHELIRK